MKTIKVTEDRWIAGDKVTAIRVEGDRDEWQVCLTTTDGSWHNSPVYSSQERAQRLARDVAWFMANETRQLHEMPRADSREAAGES